MQQFLKLVIFVGLGYLLLNQSGLVERYLNASTNTDSEITEAYKNRRSDLQIRGSGEVIRVLSDDVHGSRHQRFILRLKSGQTLLVSHNIDLAPRLTNLTEGDVVDFYGEYEWNEKGGVIHWTHEDPQGHHVAGWLKHRGTTYQ